MAALASCLLLGISLRARQDPAAQPAVLDRTIPGRPDGPPFLPRPSLPDASHVIFLNIGRVANIPIGVEAVNTGRYQDPGKIAAALKAQPRVSLVGMTVREALNAVAAGDPRYHWIEMHGMPVVRPREAWVDPDNPLNKYVGRVDWDHASFSTALHEIFTALTGDPHGAFPPKEPYFPVRLPSASVLDILNEIARVNGSGRWYALYDCMAEVGVADTLLLQLETFPEPNAGLGSCRRYKPAAR
jgi:hypothetical protein